MKASGAKVPRSIVTAVLMALTWQSSPAAVSNVLYGTTGNGTDASVLYSIDTVPTGTTLDGNSIAPVKVDGADAVNIVGLAYKEDTNQMYGLINSVDLNVSHRGWIVHLDLLNGVATKLFKPSVQPLYGLAFNGFGDLYSWAIDPGVSDLVKINLETNATQIVGDAGISSSLQGFAFNRSDTTSPVLFFLDEDQDYFHIDISTGSADFKSAIQPENFDGSNGDINPDQTAYLEFWQPENDGGANSRIKVFNLTASAASVVSETRTTVTDLQTLAFALQATEVPSAAPSLEPSATPTSIPSATPSAAPSPEPSATPTGAPSAIPSAAPSPAPSVSKQPSAEPSESPTSRPSVSPSALPSPQPSNAPSTMPSESPSKQPTIEPTASGSCAESQKCQGFFTNGAAMNLDVLGIFCVDTCVIFPGLFKAFGFECGDCE